MVALTSKFCLNISLKTISIARKGCDWHISKKKCGVAARHVLKENCQLIQTSNETNMWTQIANDFRKQRDIETSNQEIILLFCKV